MLLVNLNGLMEMVNTNLHWKKWWLLEGLYSGIILKTGKLVECKAGHI